MRLHQHVIVSAGFSAAVYGLTGSGAMAVASAASGVLIDVDHVLDYWRDRPFSLDVREFFRVCEGYRLTRTFLWMHSLELALPIALAVWVTRSPVITGLALGWAQHLLMDHLTNHIRPGTYSFFWRMKRAFDNGSIFIIPENTRDKHGNDTSAAPSETDRGHDRRVAGTGVSR